MLLTEEENPYLPVKYREEVILYKDLYKVFNEGAKAQLKKVVEWGNGYCLEHPGSLRRHSCYQCWQSLLKEVE